MFVNAQQNAPESKSFRYPLQSPFLINRMIRGQQIDNLALISEQYLKNAFDDVRFGSHNTRGIFGACPGEMLHLAEPDFQGNDSRLTRCFASFLPRLENLFNESVVSLMASLISGFRATF